MRRLATFALATAAVLGMSAVATADPIGFSGPYAPGNWTLTLTNSNGTVNTAGAPNSITITSSDGIGNFNAGNTDYTITAPASGQVSFSWNYTTVDPPAVFDPFGYLLNGQFIELTDEDIGNQSGVASFFVNAGDIFGFRANSFDNFFGRSTTTISNFNAPQITEVPEPATLAVFGLLAAGGGLFARRRKASAA
jgi:hypothetical protein